MIALLLAGLGLACLPKLLLGLLVIVLFIGILWLIITKLAPAAFAEYAKWVVLVVLLIVLLIALIQVYQSGIGWLCS